MTNPTPIDITNLPELRHLVEQRTTSLRDRESVALLMPLGTTHTQHPPITKENVWADYDTDKVRAALAQSAGTLAEVNRKNLLTDIRNERSQENTHRPF